MEEKFKNNRFLNVLIYIFFVYSFYLFYYKNATWFFLDYINLAYHEAGHIFLSFGGQVLHFWGGTIGQLFFPFVLMIVFSYRKDYFSSSMMLTWLGQNGLNISFYVEDAIEMRLPLVGGGIHDWNWLLSHYNKLDRCYDYALITRKFSYSLMIGGLCLGVFFLVISFFQKD